MGEKGNDAGVVAVAAGVAAEPSLVERVTTTTTQTVVGASEDVLAKLKDKAIDQGTDAVIDEVRGRVRDRGADATADSEATGSEGTGTATSGDGDDAAPPR